MTTIVAFIAWTGARRSNFMATKDPLIIKLSNFYSYLATICIHTLAIQRTESLMDAMPIFRRSVTTLVQLTL